jgi:hypothetical protein
MSSTQPPSREQVEARFLALLDGSQTRDQVDRWAAQWVARSHADDVRDEHVWWALTLLHGVDLRHGKAGPYLHNDGQIRGWLEDFRARCSPTGPG